MERGTPFFSITLVRPSGLARLDLSGVVERFEYLDRERRADKLTLTVTNEDLAHFDEPVWKKGELIDVTWGYPGNAAPTRRCVIQSVIGARSLQIEALGQEILMARERKTRTFENVTRSEVVTVLVREAGFEAMDIQETTERYETIVQARRTDFEFVRRLANLEGFQVYADWDGFHWHERRVGLRPTKVYEWNAPFGDVEDFEVENDITARPGRVRLRGRNPETGEDFTAEAGNDAASGAGAEDVLAPITEIIDPETLQGREGAASDEDAEVLSYAPWARAGGGVGILSEALSAENRAAAMEERPTSAPTREAALREARARQRATAQAAVKMNLELIGDPGLLAKSVVELRGFGRRLSQRYYVVEVSHSIDRQSGYDSRAKLISDGHGGHSTETDLAQGLSAFNVGVPARGRQNDAAPAPGAEPAPDGDRAPPEGAELEEVSRIDPETGEEVLSWSDSRGRSRYAPWARGGS